MQKSESFLLSALLSFSGGFQDAYTYNVREQVFANAQTGNIVLMSQSFLSGKFLAGCYYLCPVIAFSFGVFVAERMESRYKCCKKIHWRQMILFMEMVCLMIAGCLPLSWNMAANILVSFSCAMQVQTFRTVHGYGYASTMCIGNLRSGVESFSQYLRCKDVTCLQKSLHFWGIIFIFALGAGCGGVLSEIFGIPTIWVSVVILFFVTILMIKKE